MILLDAVYINNSGGKVLLDYLIHSLENTDLEVFYLLDSRISSSLPKVKNPPTFISSSEVERWLFYSKRKSVFNTVLCFGNVPPPLRLKTKVYVYFHQLLFLRDYSLFEKVKNYPFVLKANYIDYIKGNCDNWIVQSEYVKRKLSDRLNVVASKVIVAPFYPRIFRNKNNNAYIPRKKADFIYVSSGAKHKNHDILLEAFAMVSKRYRNSTLHLTVSDDTSNLFDKIKHMQSDGVNVVNHGTVQREELFELYSSCRFIVYPSLYESFGLGILEGIDLGCDVIGSDLPYLYAVCHPSAIFDPKNVKSIYDTLISAIQCELPRTKVIVGDEIDVLLKIVSNNRIVYEK